MLQPTRVEAWGAAAGDFEIRWDYKITWTFKSYENLVLYIGCNFGKFGCYRWEGLYGRHGPWVYVDRSILERALYTAQEMLVSDATAD